MIMREVVGEYTVLRVPMFLLWWLSCDQHALCWRLAGCADYSTNRIMDGGCLFLSS